MIEPFIGPFIKARAAGSAQSHLETTLSSRRRSRYTRLIVFRLARRNLEAVAAAAFPSRIDGPIVWKLPFGRDAQQTEYVCPLVNDETSTRWGNGRTLHTLYPCSLHPRCPLIMISFPAPLCLRFACFSFELMIGDGDLVACLPLPNARRFRLWILP